MFSLAKGVSSNFLRQQSRLDYAATRKRFLAFLGGKTVSSYVLRTRVVGMESEMLQSSKHCQLVFWQCGVLYGFVVQSLITLFRESKHYRSSGHVSAQRQFS